MSNQRAASNADNTVAYWHSISVFSFYRIIIAGIFVASHFVAENNQWWLNTNQNLSFKVALAYLLVGFVLAASTWVKWPPFNRQVTFQVIIDIGFIVALMFAGGGIKSGLGLLLVIVVTAASLISDGRLSLFYASVATVSLLLEQSYEIVSWNDHYNDYTHVVMLCLSCFATAWLAHTFAKRTHLSESLAEQRGIDLENMSQINALITQEMKDGVLIVDSELKLRHYNQQAERVLGTTLSSLNKNSIEELSPELAFILQSWMQNEPDNEAIRFSFLDLEYRLRFMSIGANRYQGAIIFIEDWSLMQAQAQQNKLAALGQLTANMAHEIRNPLGAISHANQLLQEENLPASATKRLLEIISINVQRMDQMVKDISELNRRDNMHQEQIDLVDFVSEFHDHFCEVEKIPAHGFALHIGDQPIHILFDQRHLHQILWNLCRNGWRHSQQESASLTLFIYPSKDNMSVVLQILDDGPGIPVEARLHIFEPFYTTVSTGTGLGLYIARELCEANGANIQYIAREKGALFSIKFKRV